MFFPVLLKEFLMSLSVGLLRKVFASKSAGLIARPCIVNLSMIAFLTIPNVFDKFKLYLTIPTTVIPLLLAFKAVL